MEDKAFALVLGIFIGLGIAAIGLVVYSIWDFIFKNKNDWF